MSESPAEDLVRKASSTPRFQKQVSSHLPSKARLFVSTAKRTTPTWQGPNSVLQDTLDSFEKTLRDWLSPWQLSTMETLIGSFNIRANKASRLFFFLSSVCFYCSGRCQSRPTNEEGERPPCSSILDATWLFFLRNIYVTVAFLIIQQLYTETFCNHLHMAKLYQTPTVSIVFNTSILVNTVLKRGTKVLTKTPAF